MPEIAKITTQKKSAQRYNIFLKEKDKEKYAFSVDEDILIQFHLRKGLFLTPQQIEQIKEKDISFKAYSLALKYLSYRMRSEREIIDYLETKEIEEVYIDEITARLTQEGLLDDLAFSEAYVRTKIETTNKGPNMIKKELIGKGIRPDYIEQALSNYSYEKQYEKIEKWVSKKLRSDSRKSLKQQLDSIKQSLVQKGFSFEIITDVLTDLEMERDSEKEYQALVYQGEKLLTKHQRKESGFALEQKVKAGLYRKGFSSEAIDRFIEETLKDE